MASTGCFERSYSYLRSLVYEPIVCLHKQVVQPSPKSVPDLPMSKLSTMPQATSTCLGQVVGIGNNVTNNLEIRAPGSGLPSTQVLTEFSNLTKLHDPQNALLAYGKSIKIYL